MKKTISDFCPSAALFSTAANADISVSGSANAVYVDAEGNSEGHARNNFILHVNNN